MLTLFFAARLVVVDRVEDEVFVVELAPHRTAVVARSCVSAAPREGERLLWQPPLRPLARCPVQLAPGPVSPERTTLTTPQGVHP